MTTQADVQWPTKGTLLQACNCDYGCPCNFNAPPTDGTCDGAWAGQIEEGNFGDADLSGLRFALGAHWPQAIHHGNGEGFIIIDERANEAQRDGLTKILTGQVGGPFPIQGGTISKRLILSSTALIVPSMREAPSNWRWSPSATQSAAQKPIRESSCPKVFCTRPALGRLARFTKWTLE